MPLRATKRGAERTPLGGSYEAVICGASFAGLAVARELAGTGARVLVLDRYAIGERQTSACAAPTGVLEQLGLDDSILQRFDELVVHTRFKSFRWRLPFAFGWLAKRGIPRELGDAWLHGFFHDRGIRRDLYSTLAAIDKADTLAAAEKLRLFDRPVLLAWAPQDRFFTSEALKDFTSLPATLTDAYDRMGVRLRGPALVPKGALSIPPEPILRGSVQVSGDGVPTVLLSDHHPALATYWSHVVNSLQAEFCNNAILI